MKLSIFLMSFIFLSFGKLDEPKIIENNGVSIEFPNNWDVMEMPGYPILVQEKAKTSEYAPLCNFVVEFDDVNNEIDSYIVHLKNKFKNSTYMTNWEVLSERDTKFKGLKAKELITTCNAAGFEFKTKIIIVKQKNRIVNLNSSSSVAEFDKNKAIIDKIYSSVKFIK